MLIDDALAGLIMFAIAGLLALGYRVGKLVSDMRNDYEIERLRKQVRQA